MVDDIIGLKPNPLVSVVILAYNNLDYTRLCIESLYRNSSHVDFELITINNGSTDGTDEYFNSLSNQKIISISENCGVDKAFNRGLQLAEGRYTVFLSNDLVLTPNWLDNLLQCVQSDEKIGMVVPVCNFSSNFQQVSLGYANIEELNEAAKKYNISDPRKWEERLRLITYAFIAKTGLLKKLGGFDEIYSPFDFDDDDISFRIRRAGYKLILARDTYIHHFGSITKGDYRATTYLQARNRRIFSSRFGVDAWDDTNIDFEMLDLVDFNRDDTVNVLGIGFRCGGTVLQAKNRFRQNGCMDVRLWGWTDDEKYLPDLKTIYEQVVCDRVENIADTYKEIKFDCIMIGYELEKLEDPELFIKRIPGILKEDGQIIFKISNEIFYKSMVNMLSGISDSEDESALKRHLNIHKLIKVLQKYGYQHIKYVMPQEEVPEEYISAVHELKSVSQTENKDMLDDMLGARKIIFSAGNVKPPQKVLFYPGSDIWQNDMVFEDRSFINTLGIDTGENFAWNLREEFRSHGYEMSTLDNPDDFDIADFVIFNDLPKYYGNRFYTNIYHDIYKGKLYLNEFLSRKAANNTKARLIARLDEPPFVMPENYDRTMHENFDIIFTYYDDLVDNKKYFKYLSPQPEHVENPFVKEFDGKKLITFVGSDKRSGIDGELYTERRKAVQFFEDNYSADFDFYGKLWNADEHLCYKGAIYNKLEIVSQYKFCICYENGILNGWISEKIFECFFARCVPIYWGAPNITDYIPANTFLDKRQFGSYEQLYDFICSMSEGKYNEYLDNIEIFLASEDYKKFTRRSFAENLVKVILAEESGSDG
ncbi:MAG: glycosyltransferase [Syntrophomonas sp.]